MKTQSLTVRGELPIRMAIPPPVPAEFLMNVQLLTAGGDSKHSIPPPSWSAEFSMNVQLLIVGEELWQYIPPPYTLAEFPLKVHSLTFRDAR
jgi:hypothetical protein